MLIILFILWGMSYQIWKVPASAYFASNTDKKHRGAEYGLLAEIVYLADVLGPLLAGAVLVSLGYFGILNIYIAAMAFCAILIMFLIFSKNKKPLFKNVKKAVNLKSWVADIKEIKYLGLPGISLVILSSLIVIVEVCIFVFEPLFYGPSGINISPYLGGLLLACFAIPQIFFSYPFGALADKYGKKKFIVLGLLVSAISLILFAINNILWLYFLFAIFYALGMSMIWPALDGLIIDLSFGHKKGKIIGIKESFLDLGFFLGPILGGLVAQYLGLNIVFFASGILFIFCILLFLFMLGRKTYK